MLIPQLQPLIFPGQTFLRKSGSTWLSHLIPTGPHPSPPPDADLPSSSSLDFLFGNPPNIRYLGYTSDILPECTLCQAIPKILGQSNYHPPLIGLPSIDRMAGGWLRGGYFCMNKWLIGEIKIRWRFMVGTSTILENDLRKENGNAD